MAQTGCCRTFKRVEGRNDNFDAATGARIQHTFRSDQFRRSWGNYMPKYKLEEIVDSLSVISSIIFRRLECMECNQCEPCGQAFMGALNVLREAGNVARGEGVAEGE
jgi:hypothetical protein